MTIAVMPDRKMIRGARARGIDIAGREDQPVYLNDRLPTGAEEMLAHPDMPRYTDGDDLFARLPNGFTDVDPWNLKAKPIEYSEPHAAKEIFATNQAVAGGLDARFRDQPLMMTGRVIRDVWPLQSYNRDAWEVIAPDGEVLFVNHLEPRKEVLLSVLQQFIDEGDEEEQRKTLESLQRPDDEPDARRTGAR